MTPQVGCAGILVSDTFCGPLQELPHEGQLLAVDALPTKAGGCAANVAIDLTKQDISVEVAGCLGTDASSKVLFSSLEQNGVGCSRIVYSSELPTSKTVILLVKGQDRRYIHSFGANAAFTVGHIDREWVKGLKVLYLGGLFLMPAFLPDELIDLLAFCRQQGVITVVDVVIPQDFVLPVNLAPLLSAVDYFLPNDDEARALTGSTEPREQLRMLLSLGAHAGRSDRTVVITQGWRGVLAGRGKEIWKAGVYTIDPVVDPSGSGDAFAAGVITGVVRGLDMPAMLRFASALGASAIRALGTTDGVFSTAEAEAFLATQHLDIQVGNL